MIINEPPPALVKFVPRLRLLLMTAVPAKVTPPVATPLVTLINPLLTVEPPAPLKVTVPSLTVRLLTVSSLPRFTV